MRIMRLNTQSGYRLETKNNASKEDIFFVTLTDLLEGGVNSPPFDLNSTTALTIMENQPVGTIIGLFTATDPDPNSVLTFELVEGKPIESQSRSRACQ